MKVGTLESAQKGQPPRLAPAPSDKLLTSAVIQGSRDEGKDLPHPGYFIYGIPSSDFTELLEVFELCLVSPKRIDKTPDQGVPFDLIFKAVLIYFHFSQSITMFNKSKSSKWFMVIDIEWVERDLMCFS